VREHPGPGTELLSLGAPSIVPERGPRRNADSRSWNRREHLGAPSRGGQMPAHDRKRPAASGSMPSEELVLAALARACRHAPRSGPGVQTGAVLDHLGIAERSAAARIGRARLTELQAGGHLRRVRHRGRELWAPTRRGSRRLERADAAGLEASLPEAPQHRAWRIARTTAALETERFHRDLALSLGQAQALLAQDPQPHSDAWFELAEALRREARRVGSAGHCLREWPEPEDARPDVDDRVEAGDAALGGGRRSRMRALRAGRRNIRLWS